MAWPRATDFLEAVQDLRASVDDEELRGGEVARTPLGLPMLWSGNFADVFKIHCPATGNTWALKCFTRAVSGQCDRYRRIAAHLEQAQLPFTVDFQYLEQGIRIDGERFPVLKMRWVEGLTLAEFVEEHLDRPGNLKMLLDLWVKLASRLREAEVAHADLQHGNVLLVPTSGSSLALRLVDYDGMYVPSLAGTPSGEVGHPAYQHPQRLREGTYNAEVDRFSHLAIYCAIRCLMLGRRELWQRFNNGDNLLFREEDFRSPRESKLFRVLWKNLPDADVRAMLGRMVLACGARLEEAPLLDEIVTDGKVLPLTPEQEAAVNALLTPPARSSAKPASADDIPLEWLTPPTGQTPAEPSLVAIEGPTSHVTLTAADLPPPPASRLRAVGKSLLGGLAAAGRPLDGFFRRLVGQENDLFRHLLWAVFPVLLFGAVWLGASTLWHTLSAPPITPKPPVAPTAELKLRAIASQTVEAGKSLSVTVTPENADAWKGKLRYSFAGQAPPGTTIDPTGRFTWTPTKDQKPGKYAVAVTVEESHGQKAQATLAITVTVPLRMVAVAPQSVEAGKPLALAVSVEEPQQWEGKLRFRLGPGGPPGANIDPQTGNLTWTPRPEQAPGKYDLAVSVETSDGRHDETSIVVTVTVALKLKPIAAQSIEVGKPLSVATAMEDADAWKGKVNYSLPESPPGATIDAERGVFHWTPPADNPPGTYDVIVSVRGPEGQSDQQRFQITVTPPLEKKIAVDLGNGVKLEMVLIPAGEFLMGSPDSDKNASPFEEPQHRVRITKPFWLGKYPVTQEQWEAVMGKNPSYFRDPNNPVESVTWDECKEFMKKLNKKVGGGRFSLPTEAQREYACRAGSKTRYCFGDDESGLGDYAWYAKNSGNRTHPVGKKKPNAWGLYDMHGNVWEWCQDWFDGDYYGKSPVDDPMGPATRSLRVRRGGCWDSPARCCRSAVRADCGPGFWCFILGLRVSRVAE